MKKKPRKSEMSRAKVQWEHSSTLPTEIITRILLCLPPKSLLKFKAVSKSWCSRIKSVSFARQYVQHSMTRPPHLMVVALDTYSREKVDFYTCDLGSRRKTAELSFRETLDEEQRGLQPPQHCNGLVLLDTTIQLHVCNPSTLSLLTLPEGCDSDSDSDDEEIYDRVAGLGFVPGDNVFKVARHVCRFLGDEGSLEVHTLGEDSYWRAIEEDPPYPICTASPLMPAGESIYFRIDETEGPPSPKAFIRFSLGEEKFDVVHPPPITDLTDRESMIIVELDGDPCLVHCSQDRRRYDLWISGSGGRGHEWTHRFSIALEQPAKFMFPVTLRGGRVLVSIRNHSELYGRLQYYDPEKRSFETVIQMEGCLDDLKKDHDIDMCCYVESLY